MYIEPTDGTEGLVLLQTRECKDFCYEEMNEHSLFSVGSKFSPRTLIMFKLHVTPLYQ
jgi:hypothetical protein